ncbi:MAG: hypothetical protein AB7I50_09770 [Vicinamibacterales bacterium]
MGLIIWIVRLIVILLVVRLVLRFVGGLMQGLRGAPAPPRVDARDRAVALVKDPVCGTYLPKEKAIAGRGAPPVYFCSEACLRAFEQRRSSSRTA